MDERRPEGTASRNFRKNQERFLNGVDYFKVPLKELPTDFVANSSGRGNPNNEMILITESGYLMLVKSFTDDLAWKVQRDEFRWLGIARLSGATPVARGFVRFSDEPLLVTNRY